MNRFLILAAACFSTLAFAAPAFAATPPPTAPVNTVAPSLSLYQKPAGTKPAIGMTLVCNPGTWTVRDTTPNYEYEWYRGITEVSGRDEYYIIKDKDALGKLRCEVTLRQDGFATKAVSPETSVISPPTVRVFLQLLQGISSDAHIMTRCGTILARPCKIYRNERIAATGALTPKIDSVPMTITLEKRVRTSTGGYRWSLKRGVITDSDDGLFRVSIMRALAVQGPGDFRIRVKVKHSWHALTAYSKFVYIKQLPDRAD